MTCLARHLKPLLLPSSRRLGLTSCHHLHRSPINTLKTMYTTSDEKRLIAVCQLNCKDSKEDNLKAGERLIREAAGFQCYMVFLPECFDIICDSKKAILSNIETIDGEVVSKYRKLASECKVWLSLGGLHEKRANNGKWKVKCSPNLVALN